jgi:ligand-binding sensor domain-containing protein
VALGLIASFAACEEDVTVPPPPPNPQIPVSQTYSKGSTGLPNNDVFALLTLSNGEFWIGTEQGIARYASISATSRISGPDGIINELNGLPNPKVRDMAELAGDVYVATWGGGFAIYDIATDTWATRSTADGLRNGSISDIEVSLTEGKVYLATNDRISIYTPSTDTFSEFLLVTREVTSTVEVRDTPGGVERWYGPRVDTIEGGPGLIDAGITVSLGTSTVFDYTQENSALPEPDVNAIYFDADSDLFWVAFSNQGLASVDADLSIWTIYTAAQGLPSNTVYSVARAASPEGGSTMWAATQNGVARLKSNGTWQGYNTSGGLSADRVRDVYSDDGSRLWVGYITGGAAKLKPADAQ